MYKLIRILLVITIIEVVIASYLLFKWKGSWLILVALAGLAVYRIAPRPKEYWAQGTARWATVGELRREGMIGGKRGISIGRLVNSNRRLSVEDVLGLVNPKIQSDEACCQFFNGLEGDSKSGDGDKVRLANSLHTIFFGPTGSGKGASFLIPWLLETDESAVVLDYAGEAARITAQVRVSKFGHQVVLNDPFRIVTETPDCHNPLDRIERDSLTLIDDANELAEQLVIKTGTEPEPHWNQMSEAFISAAIVAVTQFSHDDDRSLQTVRNILSNPQNIPRLIEMLCTAEGPHEDIFARLGGQLSYVREKELASVLSTVSRHMRWMDTPAMIVNTSTSTFDPRRLRQTNKMTVYCILPAEFIRSHAGWIHMNVGSLMRAVVRGGLEVV